MLAAVLVASCGESPTASGPPATFTAIYAAMFPLGTRGQCNYCHSVPPNNISNGNLGMGETRAAAYAALVGATSMSSVCGGRGNRLVVPGDPAASLLYVKVTAAPGCGVRMPQGGTALTDAQIEMIRSWIAAGAPND